MEAWLGMTFHCLGSVSHPLKKESLGLRESDSMYFHDNFTLAIALE